MTEPSKPRYYQSLGNGVYRVSGAVKRNAVTGRYITKSNAGGTSSGSQKAAPSSSEADRKQDK